MQSKSKKVTLQNVMVLSEDEEKNAYEDDDLSEPSLTQKYAKREAKVPAASPR
jgi:hypothetical protein